MCVEKYYLKSLTMWACKRSV